MDFFHLLENGLVLLVDFLVRRAGLLGDDDLALQAALGLALPHCGSLQKEESHNESSAQTSH